ncbi:MAG: Putative sulfatase [uncultured Rubrobacteraceae bacterium]|uniref:Sulfatase n=1 Tax=uncultured Rubrobacteraceae bacterium TaxID=349277 RepID=A0A6J4QZS8_9ACTN|nr:MAG: Putative sulfatase [uncultured Rubrobacteraceae bacterium]
MVGILLLCLVVSLLVGCSGSAPDGDGAQASDRPNVVFVLADDMRADDFEYMPQTRQLLAEEGLAFENAFVTHSLCCPSRASILRGQYTHNHQVWTNNPPDGGFSEFRSMGHEDSTVATWLKEEGYQTALIGKYLNGYARRDEETHVPPGWDEWHGVLGGGSYYDYRLNENGQVVSYGGDEQDYQTDVLADKARDYVRRVAKSASPSPFFLYLAPGTPHGPFVPAPRHEGAYGEDGPGVGAPRPPSFYESDVSDKPEWVRDLPLLESVEETTDAGEEATEEGATGSDEESAIGTEEMIDSAYRNRLEMLLSLDEMVAGLVDELRAAGELDNTYVFFTSDNGYHFGEHRINQGKRTVYEETVRVPLAVRGPGVPAGAVEQMALNIDHAPTIAELTGASAPEFVDGRSLAPFLRGAPPEIWRSAFLIQHYSGGNAQHRSVPTYAAVRTETHKYVDYENGDRELYDLEADPYELESLHESADPTLIAGLEARLEALRACASESCREAESAP